MFLILIGLGGIAYAIITTILEHEKRKKAEKAGSGYKNVRGTNVK